MATGLKLLRVGALAAALWMTASDGRHAHALSRTYLCINFDLDSAEISPRCLQIITEFANHWRSTRDGRHYEPRVEVTAYSAEGERDANNLAFLRAARVARELERLGVPEHVIHIRGYANRPLETSDRRAAVNRRVELVDR